MQFKVTDKTYDNINKLNICLKHSHLEANAKQNKFQ